MVKQINEFRNKVNSMNETFANIRDKAIRKKIPEVNIVKFEVDFAYIMNETNTTNEHFIKAALFNGNNLINSFYEFIDKFSSETL
jgi:gluconate kinase